jgi:deoxycytidylate deaminase
VKELEELAFNSNHPSARIAAAIVYKNKIISKGYNEMKSSPFQKRYSSNEEAIYLHAETSAIQRSIKLGFDKFQKSILYVVRVKWDSPQKNHIIYGNCCPCDGCMKGIKRFNIGKVIYTLDQIVDSENHFGFIEF